MKIFGNVVKLREKLEKEGRSLTWFHANYLSATMTRGAMYQQLTKGGAMYQQLTKGCAPSGVMEKAIEKYLNS